MTAPYPSPPPPPPPSPLVGPNGLPLPPSGGQPVPGLGGGGLAGLLGGGRAAPDVTISVGPVYPARMLDENGKPRHPKKPSPSACQAKATRDESKHQRLVQRFLNDLRRYRQKQGSSGVFEDFDPTVDISWTTTQASTQVNKVANMGAGMPWRYELPYRTRAERKASQRIETWAAHFVDTWTRQHGARYGTDLKWDMFWHALVLGHLAGRCVCDLDDADFPWTVELLNPMHCFPTFGGPKDGVTVVTEIKRSTYGAVIDEFGIAHPDVEKKLLGKQQKDDSTWGHANLERERSGKLVTYVDAWWHGTWFDEIEIVPLTAHEYLEVPYVFAVAPGEPPNIFSPDRTSLTPREWSSGYRRGQSFDEWDIAEKGPSFFHHVENALLQQEAVYSILMTQAKQATNPATITESPYDDPPEPFDFGPGGNNVLRQGERVQPVPTSSRPSDVGPLLAQSGSEIGKAMLPDAVFGEASGSQISGYAEDSMRAATRDRVLVYFAMVQRFGEGILGLAAREFRSFGHLATTDGRYSVPYTHKRAGNAIVDDLDIENTPPEALIALAQLGIGPPDDEPEVQIGVEDFNLVGSRIKVKLATVSLQNLTQMMNVANMALNAPMPMWSWEHAAEYLNVDDPDLMRQQIIVDKAMMDPLILKTVIYPQAFAKSGNTVAYDAYMKELRMAQAPGGMQGGGGGAPGGPQALPQGVRGPQTVQGDSQPAVEQGPGVGGRPSGGQTDFNPT